jgi:exodeoxyribonuclease VII large subunit
MSQPSFDLDLDDGGLPTLTVRELAEAINGALRRGFFEGVWVRGEVQGLNERNGHLYFSLADDGEDGKATIAVSLFANVRFKLRPLLQRHRLRLADGMKVRIHGFPDFFAPSGRLSLKMSGIDPRYTLGELALQRDDLVRQLVVEGLYDAQSRLGLPAVPLHVGLVTSVGSAAWHDVTDELARSGFGFLVVACDARVQGEWAADMVAAAIRTLGARTLDVLLVVRGGGARADLATFDSAAVARAIAQSPVPVITGLGHEVDRSVADEVARLALKTPTACAAELVGRVSTFRAAAEGAWAAIEDQTQIRLDRAHRGLGNLAGHAARQTRSSVGLAEARLAGHVERLPRDARRRVQGASAQLVRSAERTRGDAGRSVAVSSGEITSAEARLVRRAPALGGAEATALQAMEARVRALDPAATLARGWSITRTSDGGLVRQATQLAAGDEIVTTLADGQVRSRVEEIRPT